MGVKKVGDWTKVEKLIGNLAKEMLDAREKSLKLWGLKAEALAKTHMSTQDLGWKPLKPKTVARKARKGQSTNILIATSDYFQAISSWTIEGTVLVGVTKTEKNGDGDVIADIARIHEFGGGNIPARPLWQPVFDETIA